MFLLIVVCGAYNNIIIMHAKIARILKNKLYHNYHTNTAARFLIIGFRAKVTRARLLVTHTRRRTPTTTGLRGYAA